MKLRPRLLLVGFLVALLILTPSALAQALSVRLVSLTSPAGRGTDASITIQTAPGATCDITVIYKSGLSRAAGLYPQKADSGGMVTWVWRVGTRTTPGRWPIIVDCSLGSRRGTL